MDSEIFSQLSTQDWVLLYITGMIIGFAKTGIAGIGILAVPIFAMIFPAEKSAGILLPVLCVADVMAVSYYRRHADWKKIGPLMPWVLSGLLGATAVYYFGNQQGTALEHFIKETMKPTMGCIVLFVLLLSMWREKHQEIPEGKKVEVITGFSPGFTSMLANAAGPIMAIYLMAVKLPKKTFIGTKAWFFLIINFIKVPLMFFGAQSINSDSLVLNAKLIPAIIIGGLLGIKAVKHIPEEKFKLAIKVLVLTASLKLIFS